jgi:hypothetical protein
MAVSAASPLRCRRIWTVYRAAVAAAARALSRGSLVVRLATLPAVSGRCIARS